MKPNSILRSWLVAAGLLFIIELSTFAQGTAFTYQGRLNDGASPANGSYDLTFAIFPSPGGGLQLAGPVTNSATPVSNGLFSVTLDFGNSPFSAGMQRWLEIAVRTNGAASFITLAQRQKFTAAPYAITAGNFTGAVGNTQLSNSSVTVTAGTGLAGGGTVALGGSTTLSNAGVLSVTGNSDITASTLNGAVTLGDTATSANTASTIVKRDGSGNFSAGTIVVNTNLTLPTTTSTAGIIYAGAFPLMHTFGANNFFAGRFAGNLTLSGAANTAVGTLALAVDTTGFANTAVGTGALTANTSGGQNVAIGVSALQSNTNGNNNIGIGISALDAVTSGSDNIGIGVDAGLSLHTGNNNIYIGNQGTAADNGRIRIGQGGTHTNVFISGISGVTAASGVAVFVNSSGQLGTLTSSKRFKRDVESMGNASEVLLSLHPVTFRYKPELDPDALPQFGLIAEEVDKVDPGLVARDDKNQIYTVRYEAVNAMLLNEFLKQHRKVEDQSAEISALKQKAAQVDALEKRLSELEQVMQSFKPAK